MKCILILFILSTLPSLNAQQQSVTYKIINPGIVENLSDYKKALNKFDLNAYRLRNERFVMRFKESGLMVELLSAQELFAKGEIASVKEFRSASEVNSTFGTFQLIAGQIQPVN